MIEIEKMFLPEQVKFLFQTTSYKIIPLKEQILVQILSSIKLKARRSWNSMPVPAWPSRWQMAQACSLASTLLKEKSIKVVATRNGWSFQ